MTTPTRLQMVVGAGLVLTIITIFFHHFEEKKRQALELERQVATLAKNIYWEAVAAKEPDIASRMVGHVTTTRAKARHRHWGEDLTSVVYKRAPRGEKIVCQFSWTCTMALTQEPGNTALWQKALAMARDELTGNFTPPPRLAGATSYLNPTASGRRNVCEFKTTLVFLGKAEPESRHEFYREPKDAIERALLPKRSEVEECKSLKPKKDEEKTRSAQKAERSFVPVLPFSIYIVCLHEGLALL